MKRTRSLYIAAALFLIGGSVQAQALFESPNIAGTVTFFSGDPASGATQLAQVPMNNSPGAVTLTGIERATHVRVEVQGTDYTFALAENAKFGANKNDILVALPPGAAAATLGREGRVSLAALFDSLLAEPTLLTSLGSPALAEE